MKTFNNSPLYSSDARRLAALLVTAVTATLLAVNCYPPISEGARCNIGLDFDECANAPTVQCMVPANCALPGNAALLDNVAFCCSPNSTNPNCQPCPYVDGGSEDGSTIDAATDAKSDGGGIADASDSG